jgi:hypothetical protein
MATTITAPAPASQLLYECTDCGERSTERRCEECNLFNRRLGAGGHCPHCDEPVLVTELLEPEQPTTQKTPSHTENLTGSVRQTSDEPQAPAGPQERSRLKPASDACLRTRRRAK